MPCVHAHSIRAVSQPTDIFAALSFICTFVYRAQIKVEHLFFSSHHSKWTFLFLRIFQDFSTKCSKSIFNSLLFVRYFLIPNIYHFRALHFDFRISHGQLAHWIARSPNMIWCFQEETGFVHMFAWIDKHRYTHAHAHTISNLHEWGRSLLETYLHFRIF